MNVSKNLNSTEEIIKNIIRQNINKLRELKKVFDISMEIGKFAEDMKKNASILADSENKGRDIIDDIADFTDKRGENIEEIKNINAAVRHHRLKLAAKYSDIIDKVEKYAKTNQNLPENNIFPAWAVNLYRLMSEQQAVLEKIRDADEKNNELIKNLIEELNKKTNSIKNNRILMDKFNQSGNDMPAGTFFKSKK